MKRISELHEQAAKILIAAQNCLDEIGYIQQTERDILKQEEMKQVYIRAYQMTMRSYMRVLKRIEEIYEGVEW